MVKGPGLYSTGNNLLFFPPLSLSSWLLSCHLDEWLIRQSVKRIIIWLGHSDGGGGVGGSQCILGSEMLGGHIVGWYNTGQEGSILLTVKIHLVRTKHSKRPELSNRPRLVPVLYGLEEIFFKDSLSISLR